MVCYGRRWKDFNPRTHRGVRLLSLIVISIQPSISIHAPIVGCDEREGHKKWQKSNFNPRTHRGVRPFTSIHGYHLISISIHAPIVGCDDHVTLQSGKIWHFNPRTHRGVRPLTTNVTYIVIVLNFNPRTHRGVRLKTSRRVCITKKFQSTHPSWGATCLM